MKLKEAAKKVKDGIEVTVKAGGLWEFCPYAGLCPATPCGRYSVGQQEVYEYEAFGGDLGGCLYCWLIAFIPKSANQFAKNC